MKSIHKCTYTYKLLQCPAELTLVAGTQQQLLFLVTQIMIREGQIID